MSATLEERSERIAEMKRQDWPRCNIERLNLVVEMTPGWEELIARPAASEQIDSYLRGFATPVPDPDDADRLKNPCPFCGVGWFGWGMVWGSGMCSCGWPATLLHVIRDLRDDPDLVCERTVNGERVCAAARGDHRPEMKLWHSTDGSREEEQLVCPVQTGHFTDVYVPPQLVRFSLLLWVHPYEVSIRRKR